MAERLISTTEYLQQVDMRITRRQFAKKAVGFAFAGTALVTVGSLGDALSGSGEKYSATVNKAGTRVPAPPTSEVYNAKQTAIAVATKVDDALRKGDVQAAGTAVSNPGVATAYALMNKSDNSIAEINTAVAENGSERRVLTDIFGLFGGLAATVLLGGTYFWQKGTIERLREVKKNVIRDSEYKWKHWNKSLEEQRLSKRDIESLEMPLHM